MRTLEGKVLADRYRLDSYLDEGAFGAVFKGVQMVLQQELREVAIKVAKRPMHAAEVSVVFRDALLMTRLAGAASPAALREHFIDVIDAGLLPAGSPMAGHPFMVMELVRGGSLKGHLQLGPFPLTRVINYFEQVLHAVAFMHGSDASGGPSRQAVIHRDLKPANLLVVRRATSGDLLKVTDFGLAVEVDSLLGWVESGGDLAYLAPESFSHKICSPQSDVYALGLIFYEMLAGENPFGEVGRHLRGTDEEKRNELCRLHVMARQLEQFPALQRHEELRRQPALAQVVRSALQPDMNTRPFRNAVELLGAWKAVRGTDEDPTNTERPWQKARRLTGEAEQCFGVREFARGDELLDRAMALNGDPRQVPSAMLVGRTHLLKVQRLIAQDALEAAGRVATDGYHRRRCRSTCQAMAEWYTAQASPAAAAFLREASDCPDQE